MFEVEELDKTELTYALGTIENSLDIYVDYVASKLNELIAAHNELAKYLEKITDKLWKKKERTEVTDKMSYKGRKIRPFNRDSSRRHAQAAMSSSDYVRLYLDNVIDKVDELVYAVNEIFEKLEKI